MPMNYHTICPECKNEIDIDQEALKSGDVIECQMCGITLEVGTVADDGGFEVSIVEEEK